MQFALLSIALFSFLGIALFLLRKISDIACLEVRQPIANSTKMGYNNKRRGLSRIIFYQRWAVWAENLKNSGGFFLVYVINALKFIVKALLAIWVVLQSLIRLLYGKIKPLLRIGGFLRIQYILIKKIKNLSNLRSVIKEETSDPFISANNNNDDSYFIKLKERLGIVSIKKDNDQVDVDIETQADSVFEKQNPKCNLNGEDYWIQAILQNPKNGIAYKKLGEIYYASSNWKDAYECFQRVIKLGDADKKILKLMKIIEQDGRKTIS